MISFLVSKKSSVKNILNTRRATAFCFLIAYINKLIIAWRFTDLEGDKALYLLISKSSLTGHFLLEPVQVWGMQHSAYIFNPASFSPVYPLVAAPFLWLTKSYYTTSLIVDGIAVAVFFAGVYYAAYYTFKQRWICNIFLLFAGCFLYQLQLDSTPKDMLAVGLILMALANTYRLMQFTTFRPGFALMCFFLYAAVALTKFLYSPLVLLFLFFLILNAIIVKNKTSVFHSLFLFLCSLVAFIAFYYFFFDYLPGTGDPIRTFSSEPTSIKGFYPENLLRTFPFISSSMTNTNFIGVQLEKTAHIEFSTVMQMFQVLDLLLAGTFVWLLVHFRNRLIKKPFVLMLTATAIAIILMVMYMSLSNKLLLFPFSSNSFTYVQEYRSFLIPMIIIQLFLFYSVFVSTKLPRKIKILLLLLLAIGCVHDIYFSTKQIANGNDGIAHISSTNKSIIQSILAQKKKEQPMTIITTSGLLRTLAMTKGLEVYSFPLACKDSIKPVKPTVVITSPGDSSLVRGCLSKANLSDSTSAGDYELRYFNVR